MKLNNSSRREFNRKEIDKIFITMSFSTSSLFILIATTCCYQFSRHENQLSVSGCEESNFSTSLKLSWWGLRILSHDIAIELTIYW
ncbi:CLUMA_CG015965, isoform A [Clunio marinus]|uniref:CLUMA_CG015965, isoform A n=1 Tax=Clunio marinus TaxID=568069 RepID=A0A1J1IQW8_9DIPT|nr:CLUMA_CG015965, isoform A [Clunio marinus]